MNSTLNDLSMLGGTPIESYYVRLLDALNNHSAEDFSSLFLDNGVFTLFDGTDLIGKEEIKETSEKLFETHPDYSYFSKITTYQKITNDLKMVVAVVSAANNSISNSMFYVTRQTVLFSKQKGKWAISMINNTLLEKENTSQKEKISLLGLSAREREILTYIVSGLSSEEISEKSGISVRTVETHRSNILKKAGCRNISSLVAVAISQGLINN